ncbi:MAG TPA: hypothetical protein VER11_20570 [Polyangiaceae bacterium]|nr:hypothetical protein [Polyangiaceae bacterium]
MRKWLSLCGVGVLCLACSGSDGGALEGHGGAAGNVGSGGFGGGAQPNNANVVVDQIVQRQIDKVDILFMLDNSPSMAEKQRILGSALPLLVGRLISPLCVDRDGQPTGASVHAGSCDAGQGTPEFTAIEDIHVGVVSSSLGAHGGTICSGTEGHLDDRAHLIGTQRSGLRTWNDSGFLAWDPAARSTPAGESDASKFVADFAAMARATGEDGCGFEASLESWYRFLIDPEPPQQVTKSGSETKRVGIDNELLAQRAAFLRSDSAVVIVMLSDENDCSIRDDGLGWMVGSYALLPKASAACESNPNDACCRSCATVESQPPFGCLSLDADPACKSDDPSAPSSWDLLHDMPNLRCYHQRQRFGLDLLYPIERYVDGLRKATLPLPSDPQKVVVNPLFDGGNGKPGRDPSLVFLAGIVGVPWQDIATTESLSTPTSIRYLSASELADNGRWVVVLGDPSASPPQPPADPFMIEASEARSGANPITNMPIAPANSTRANVSPINGHEQNIPNLDDLQYACIFPLAEPKDCSMGDAGCECTPAKDGSTQALEATNSPLCQPPVGGPAGTTQYFGKAYPGTRQLSVLKGSGSNSIVASICPKVLSSADPSADLNYGYNPALRAIGDRLKEALGMKCLPRVLGTKPDTGGSEFGAIGCKVIEVQASGRCDCGRPGRGAAPSAIVSGVFAKLQTSGACGATGQPKCDSADFCACQITQETGDDLTACVLNAATPTPGFCYIDEPTSSALEQCPPNQQQRLRFVGEGDAKIPAEGALLFMACEGHTL